MGIKRYTAAADTTIVNAYKPSLTTRGTGSNAGQADITEIFSVYGRQSSGSQELSRGLLKFSMEQITTDRTAGQLPASGSVSFYLRVSNAPHSKPVPENFTLVAQPVTRAWQEGIGLDLEGYKDEVKGNTGANWISASKGAPWTLVGGDYDTAEYTTYKQTFETGLEDVEINITTLVEEWIDSSRDNNGIGLHLTASQEAYFSGSVAGTVGMASGSVLALPDGATTSYYTKRLFARGTQYFFKKPVIEARWESVVKDNRGDFNYSSSLLTSDENLNTLYLYNYVRGSLRDIPAAGAGSIYLSLYSGSSAPTGSKIELYNGDFNVTGGRVSTGIYSASVCVTASSTMLDTLFDVWHDDAATPTELTTGSVKPTKFASSQQVAAPRYVINITNLEQSYRSDEASRFRLFVREKGWSPTIYSKANSTIDASIIHSASYRVFRVLDGLEAVPYGTGSNLHTLLSYDVSGNYFDFDMDMLEPGYAYAFKFAFRDSENNSWSEQPYTFKFRVEDYEY